MLGPAGHHPGDGEMGARGGSGRRSHGPDAETPGPCGPGVELAPWQRLSGEPKGRRKRTAPV